MWQHIKTFGADMVLTLMDVQLTAFDAQQLLHKLAQIDDIVTEYQHQQAQEET